MGSRWRRGVAAAIPLAICVAQIAGCASAGTASSGPSPSPPASAPGGTGTPAAGGSTSPPATNGASTLTVTDRANGQSVHLQPGQSLQVVLSSTYWMIHGSSNAAVLSQTSGPSPQPQRSGCVPGGGCGTVTAVYRALAVGQAQVTASRTSCGEAMGCTAASSHFVVYVIVD
jgi:hypothetical protein